MAPGRRLSKAEIRQHKQWLAAWRAPKNMLEYLSDVMGSLGKGVFGAGILYTQAGLRFLHEAHVAGTFAIARRASSVRLILNDPPDFEMRFSTRTEQFECIEADVSGRRRGDEYGRAAQLCNDDDGFSVELEPVKELDETLTEIQNALRIAVSKKTIKIYQNKYNLVIDLNFDDAFPNDRIFIEQLFKVRIEDIMDKFSNIWMLWIGRSYHIWSHDEPSDQMVEDPVITPPPAP